MPIADAVAGARRPGQQLTWLRTDGTPEDLTGATLSGVLLSLSTQETRAIAGSLLLAEAGAGVFNWEYAAADVVAGRYRVQFTATFPGGATPARTFQALWTVHTALVVAP